MPLYAIIRDLSGLSASEQEAMIFRSLACAPAWPGLRWYRSFGAIDGSSSLCFYEALEPQDLKDHAVVSRVPWSEIVEVDQIEDSTASVDDAAGRLFLVERQFGDSAGRDALERRVAAERAGESAFGGFNWRGSFWDEAGKRSFCVVQATDASRAFAHAEAAGLPCTVCSEVEEATPADFPGYVDHVAAQNSRVLVRPLVRSEAEEA